jgi:L-threonylcarbamoyladenylate synthase
MAKVLQIDPENPDHDALLTIVHELIHGRVIIYPTDTIYGIGADACHPEAVARVFEIKKRDPEKPILLLVNSLEMVSALVEKISDSAIALIEKFWPGPLTLIFQSSPRLSHWVTGRGGTVGLRYPNHPLCLKILEMCDHPITSTSANISGEKELISVREIVNTFSERVDLIVDAGDAKSATPSTIVDVTSDQPRLVREGAIDRIALRAYLQGDTDA